MRRIFLLMLLVFFVLVNAQQSNAIVSDIRIKLMESGNTSEDEVVFRNYLNDPVSINMLHDSIRLWVKSKLNVTNVLIDVNSMKFLKGLMSKEYNYKSVEVDDQNYIIVIETIVGLADVLKYNEYELVTNIKILNFKKKKISKTSETIILPEEDELNDKFILNETNFNKAYLESIKNTIDNIKSLNK